MSRIHPSVSTAARLAVSYEHGSVDPYDLGDWGSNECLEAWVAHQSFPRLSQTVPITHDFLVQLNNNKGDQTQAGWPFRK